LVSLSYPIFGIVSYKQVYEKWSPTGKARGTYFTPRWGDIPAKGRGFSAAGVNKFKMRKKE
jgi:hypothetical protein